MRIDGTHHAAGIVAACRDRVEQNVMEALDRRPQVVLEQPVELEGLPRRQPQRLLTVGAGKSVHLQPLRRRAYTARKAHAGHELIGWLKLLPPAFIAQVTVVLLI